MLRVGRARVDLSMREIRLDGRTQALSQQEAAILEHLVAAEGRPVERRVLLVEALGYREGVETRALDHAITRLRRKLGGAELLPSVYGVGYRLVFEVPDEGLVGRAEDLARLRATDGLVLLIGPGGVGKTRLARALGPELWCDLRAVRDLDGLREALGRLVGGDPEQQLPRRTGTLVLDNFEQLGADCEAWIAELHGLAPELRILVTSRHRHGLPAQVVTLSGLDESGVVELLARHAEREVDPGPALLKAIAGLPLAVELCAARLRIASEAELEVRVDRPGALGIEAVIAWSHELLSPEGRAALAACGAFVEGFELPAWEAVWGGPDALARLQELLDSSLVGRGEGRFQVLEPVRLFAVERTSEQHRARHVRHYALLGDRHAEIARLEGRLAPLARERGNLLAAAGRATDDPDLLGLGRGLDVLLGAEGATATRPRILGDLQARATSPEVRAELGWRRADALRRISRLDEARGAVAEALEVEATRGPGLLNLGGIHLQGGQLDEAERSFREAAACLRARGDRARAGSADFNRATVLALQGQIEPALKLGSRALVEIDAAGAPALRAPILGGLAAFALEGGKPEVARSYLERAREQGDPAHTHHRLHLVYALAHVDLTAGRFDTAIAGFSQVEAEAEAAGEEPLLADALEGRAAVFAERRDYREARQLLERATILHRRHGRAAEEERATVRAALVDALIGLPGRPRLDELRSPGEPAARCRAFLDGDPSWVHEAGPVPIGHELRLAARLL